MLLNKLPTFIFTETLRTNHQLLSFTRKPSIYKIYMKKINKKLKFMFIIIFKSYQLLS